MKDPIVDEVREIRTQHQTKFHDSWDEIINDFQKLEQKSSRQMVSLPPKKIVSKKSAG
jgi:hypothetical protein